MRLSRISLSLTLTLLLSIAARAQQIPVLTDSARISLITCGPGNELYSSFGHTAIRVYDPLQGIDYTYNYGTFDFDQPNFYLNFTRGNLLYMLSVGHYRNFVRVYRNENRSVHEQYLRLDADQRQALFEFVEWNAEPENRSYAYDYFFDNCSTRPRDVIAEVLGEKLVWDSSYVDHHRSIRSMCDDYILRTQPWGDLGIDICLGSRIDRTTSAWEHTYLPYELERAVDHAYVQVGDSVLPLVSQKWDVVVPEPTDNEVGWFAPQPVFVAVLLVVAMLVTFMRMGGWFAGFLEGTVFFLTGLLGVLLAFLWFGTSHATAAWNLNLAWALPTDLVFAMALFRRQRPAWVRWYAIFMLVLCALLLIFWGMLPQMLHYSLRFIVILKMFLALGVFRTWAGATAKSI